MTIRCSVCGKIIRGKPISRKTCCINKPFIFCSEKCMRVWLRSWLRREGTMVTRKIAQRHI